MFLCPASCGTVMVRPAQQDEDISPFTEPMPEIYLTGGAEIKVH